MICLSRPPSDKPVIWALAIENNENDHAPLLVYKRNAPLNAVLNFGTDLRSVPKAL